MSSPTKINENNDYIFNSKNQNIELKDKSSNNTESKCEAEKEYIELKVIDTLPEDNNDNNNNILIPSDNNNKKKKKNIILKTVLGIVTGIIILILVILIGFLIYLRIYSHATENALSFMNDKDEVTVKKIDTGYFFDGPGTENALIFYPGGKVEETAYAEILHGIAKQGIDCFLVKMPFRMALFSINKANKVIENNSDKGYKNWYIAGHSLGGAMAGYFVNSYSEKVNGFALLAAYSTKPIPESVHVLSIVASNDKVLQWEKYNDYKKNLPSNNFNEIIIQGGNHGQFGDYGKQKGDGEATISLEEQHKQIIEAIIKEF
ncbi:hypothetical protein BCR36DRAFT_587483, partial [Piromyces finnis]